MHNASRDHVASTSFLVPFLQHLGHYFRRYERILYSHHGIWFRDQYVMNKQWEGGPSVLMAQSPNRIAPICR